MIDKQQVLDLMDTAEAVYLATVSPKGPRIRALVNLRRADRYPHPSKTARTDDFTVYMSTSRSSDKVREIAADSNVSVYYSEPKTFHGVMLCGTAEVVEDPAVKLALWSEDWRIYWADGPLNPDHVILRVRVSEVRGWWGSEPFVLA